MYSATLNDTSLNIFLFGALACSLIFGFFGYAIVTKKGRLGKEGFRLGFFLWLGGLVICAFLPDQKAFKPVVHLAGTPLPGPVPTAEEPIPAEIPSWTGGAELKLCPACTHSVPATAIFCPYCGADGKHKDSTTT